MSAYKEGDKVFVYCEYAGVHEAEIASGNPFLDRDGDCYWKLNNSYKGGQSEHLIDLTEQGLKNKIKIKTDAEIYELENKLNSKEKVLNYLYGKLNAEYDNYYEWHTLKKLIKEFFDIDVTL